MIEDILWSIILVSNKHKYPVSWLIFMSVSRRLKRRKKHFDDLFEKFCAQTSEKLFERFSREKMGSHWQSALEILCLAIKCTLFTSLCTCETFPSPTVLFIFAIDFQAKLEFYFQNWFPIKMSPTLLVITIFPKCFQGLRNVALVGSHMPSFRDCFSRSENRESFTPLTSDQTTLTFVINNSRLQFSTVGFVASLELTKIRRRRFLIDEVWINQWRKLLLVFFPFKCYLRCRLELYALWWIIVGRSHLFLEMFYWQSIGWNFIYLFFSIE